MLVAVCVKWSYSVYVVALRTQNSSIVSAPSRSPPPPTHSSPKMCNTLAVCIVFGCSAKQRAYRFNRANSNRALECKIPEWNQHSHIFRFPRCHRPPILMPLYSVYLLCMNAPLNWKVLNTRIMHSLCFYSTSKLALLSMRVKCSTYYTWTHIRHQFACTTMKITSAANVFGCEERERVKWKQEKLILHSEARREMSGEDSEKKMQLSAQFFKASQV